MEVEFEKRPRSLIKNKDFMLLLIGQIVSNIGNAVHSAAVAWFIMDMVGKNSAGMFMAIFGMCSLIPYIIFGPLSGVFVDKLNRKMIIVGTDMIRGSLILILGVFTYFKIVPIIVLFVVTVLSAFFGTFFNPAVNASIPNVVEEDKLTKANSINGISTQMTYIVGAAISGFLYYYIGIVGVFIVNGISFILSAVSEMFITLPPVKKEETAKNTSPSFWKDFKDGIKFIAGNKPIIIMLGFALLLNLLFNPIFQILFPKTINFTLGMSAREYGIMDAIFSAGAIGGMIILSLIPQQQKYHKMIFTTLIIQSALLAMFGLPVLLFVHGKATNNAAYMMFCVLAFTMMIANAMLNVPIFTIFQKMVPDEYRGRFFGVLNTLTQGIVPLGLIIIGAISDVVPAYAIFIVAGVISLLLSIRIIFVPELKEL